MGKLEKYSSYKDSGVEWIGEIPDHWDVQKLKFNTKIETGNSISDSQKSNYENIENESYPYVATKDINYDYSTINYDNGLRIPVIEKNFKVARSNSTLICIEGGSAGKKIAYNIQDICYVNKLASIQSINNNAPKFLYYLTKSYVFKKQFELSMNGLIGGVSISLMKNFELIFPPKQEQTKIASFLDEKTAKIDNAISQKEKLIELLKERRQITINEAVTKGLDKSVALKESGVEWIGEIPEHWEIIKFKHLFYEKKKSHDISLNCGSISFGKVVEKNDEKIPVSTKASYQVLNKGEFLINPLNLNYDLKSLRIGLSCLDVVVSSGYIVIKNRIDLDKNYFNWLLHRYDIAFMKTLGAGVRQTLNYGDIGETLLVNPPINEQKQIAQYIEIQTTKIDKAIELQQNYIAKLKEYKASLIDSVVTGKVRVA